jgi:hypothetical protein
MKNTKQTQFLTISQTKNKNKIKIKLLNPNLPKEKYKQLCIKSVAN